MRGKAVLDESVIIALVVPEDYSEWAEKKVSEYEELHVLELTLYEVYNALWKKYALLREINKENLKNAVKAVDSLLSICNIHRFEIVKDRALKIAISYRITIYDAAYLALTEFLDGVLVTTDIRLKTKLVNTQLNKIIVAPRS